jgi:uncharacterized protein YndB with AHSA1/START domain
MSTKVVSKQNIKVPPAQVFYALTHAEVLHEWLCDFATVAPRPGGRMYLWWHGDFYSAGEYISLEVNKSIKFKWDARFDPQPTEVTISLDPEDDGTMVVLEHSVPDGDEWAERAKGFKSEWDSTLPNLASVLETGIDKRTYDRPMLGINISDFNSEIAEKLHIPVTDGMRLDDVRSGMGAHSAGLCKDDVLVELNGIKITTDYGSLVAALAGKKGGDQVSVVFYRGPKKKQVTMTLSSRRLPDIPWDAKRLSKQVRAKYDEALEKLEACFKDCSEAEADHEPAPGEWSAKQTLGHLIQTERVWLGNLDDAVGGFERLSDDWGGNLIAHINATVKAYGTARGLLDELHRLSNEMAAFVEALPDAFIQRKSSYFLNAVQLLELESHSISHVEQIQAAIISARNR